MNETLKDVENDIEKMFTLLKGFQKNILTYI